MYAALVKDDEQILVYKLLEKEGTNFKITSEDKFKTLKKPTQTQIKGIFDLFIFNNEGIAH